MKITYIVGIFPKLSTTFILSQITDLIDMGHEVEIISISMPTEEVIHEDIIKYDLLKKTHYLKRNQSSLGFELDKNLMSALLFTDIIHAHFAAHPTDLALNIFKILGIPYVFTAHAYDIFISPDKNILREKFESAAKVITISDFNRNYLLNMLGEDLKDKIEIIRCGVRLESFKYIKRQQKDNVRILLVGRFVEKKGIRYAIEAFSDVVKEYPNTELRIIGDGELEHEIINLIKTQQLQEKIILLGPKPQSEVIKEIGAADIFLLPSVTASNGDREGVPVSIMEAAATGLPVVSTRHSGIPEVVLDGETGFLVPEKDVKSIATKLKELVRDPERRERMGKQGRAQIEKIYSHRDEMKILEGLFKDLLSGKPNTDFLSQGYRELLDHRLKIFNQQRDSDIAALRKTCAEKNEQIAALKKTCSEKDEQIAALKKKEDQLSEILGSKSWKIVKTMNKVRTYLLNKNKR